MKVKTVYRVIIVILALSVFLAVLLAGVSMFLIFFKISTNRNSENKEIVTYDYQFCEYNPQTSEIILGEMTVIDEIDGVSETYEDKEGNFVMVSGPHVTEYLCSGECMCISEITPSSKGVRFLHGTIELEMSQARKQLEELCRSRLKSSCAMEEDIMSSLYDCRTVYRAKNKNIESEEEVSIDESSDDVKQEEEEKEEEEEEEEKEETALYWCSGHCVANPQLINDELQKKAKEECPYMKKEVEIVISVPPGEKTLFETMVEATEKFTAGHLDEFCKDTIEDYEYRQFFKWYQGTVQLCWSRSFEGINPSVRCRLKSMKEKEES